jgi:hypothetical protein
MLRLADSFSILRPLLEDANSNVRLAAVDALDEVNDPRAVPILLHAAAADSSHDVREASLHELRKYRSDEILRLLLSEANRHHSSRRPRQIIAEQLKEYNAEEAVDALLELARDEDVYVQERAIESLFRLNRARLGNFWTSIERRWKGTYWGNLASDALLVLGNSNPMDRFRRGKAPDASSRLESAPVRAESRPSRTRRRAADAPRSGGTQSTISNLDAILYSMVRQLSVDIRCILYKDVFEKASAAIVSMASKDARERARAGCSTRAPRGLTGDLSRTHSTTRLEGQIQAYITNNPNSTSARSIARAVGTTSTPASRAMFQELQRAKFVARPKARATRSEPTR